MSIWFHCYRTRPGKPTAAELAQFADNLTRFWDANAVALVNRAGAEMIGFALYTEPGDVDREVETAQELLEEVDHPRAGEAIADLDNCTAVLGMQFLNASIDDSGIDAHMIRMAQQHFGDLILCEFGMVIYKGEMLQDDE